jgi:hypothetical protein
MMLRKMLRFALLAAPAILLSGCATSALWEEGRFAHFREPAAPSHLQLFHAREGEDVLVRYDEVRDMDPVARPRAYWLAANHEPVKNPHKPRFVAVKKSAGLTPIPILDSTAANAPGAAGVYAIASTNAQEFTLRSGEQNLGNYELPIYEEASGKVRQVLLTPFAFAADLTVIGGIIVIYCWPRGSFSP